MMRIFNDSRFRADRKYKQINYVTVISEAVIQRISEVIQKKISETGKLLGKSN